MIQESCTSNEWISEIAKTHKADKGLVQKLIRALILLEGLSESNLKFVFKGGTALMLMLNSTKRLSIDIDIIISEKAANLDELLSEIALKKGFIRVEEKHRNANSGIEKAHYKFYYPNSLRENDEEFILLDILFEDNHYNKLISTPIQSSFITHEGEIIETITPDFNNIMGDKLTAFAPNTTGIPYEKSGRTMGQEIIKQLYDIGNIFEKIDDVAIVKTVFTDFALIELKYRNMGKDVNIVMDDIVGNCLSISLRQQVANTNYEVMQLGLRQIANYIFSERYLIEKAIVHASRTAYLIALIKTETAIERFDNKIDMSTWQIEQPNNTKLNKHKKSNTEAFFYWFKYYSLVNEV
jgi:hypothetical protein